MKFVSLAEVYTTIKKCISMNSGNHWVDNYCLKFLHLGWFCFCTSVFRLLIPQIFNETNSLSIVKVAFETWIFLVCFSYFWKDKSFTVSKFFISEYVDKFLHRGRWRRHFLVKLQTENLCFFLRWKLKKTQAA